MSWQSVVAGAAIAAAVSPLLASWTVNLATDGESRRGWWRPRRVAGSRVLTLAVLAALAGAAAGWDRPHVAWWLLAIGGTVLAVVDVATHELPARLAYPFGAAVGLALVIVAAVDGDYARLTRAAIALGAVGLVWLALAFLAGGAIGLGDVRLAAVTAAPLGWTGWADVWHAQLLLILAAGGTALAVVIARPDAARRKTPVPLGPALITGALLAPLLGSLAVL